MKGGDDLIDNAVEHLFEVEGGVEGAGQTIQILFDHVRLNLMDQARSSLQNNFEYVE
jgi:hypothetical protein